MGSLNFYSKVLSENTCAVREDYPDCKERRKLMVRKILFVGILGLSMTGCAAERLHVTVLDQDGDPVSNALVRVRSKIQAYSAWTMYGRDSDYMNYEGRTDDKGRVDIDIDCSGAEYRVSANAEGYYKNKGKKGVFSATGKEIGPGVGKIILTEHRKEEELILYKIKNPQPMYAYTDMAFIEKRAPWQNGRYGYDLEMNDWLPPHGNGKFADFYVVRKWRDVNKIGPLIGTARESDVYRHKRGVLDYPAEGDVVGAIEFEPPNGAYIRKKNKGSIFSTTYAVDRDERFETSFSLCCKVNVKDDVLETGVIVDEDSYMVIRSRSRMNEVGEITSAHYSKIDGPFAIEGILYAKQLVFNPRPNDTNLESDPARNLVEKKSHRSDLP